MNKENTAHHKCSDIQKIVKEIVLIEEDSQQISFVCSLPMKISLNFDFG